MITLSHDELTEIVRKAFLEGATVQQGTHLYSNDRFVLDWAKQFAEKIVSGTEKVDA